MKAHLHSVVSAITNSSTEIYTWVSDNAITQAKKNVKAYLDLLGIEKSVDELFDFEARISYEKPYVDPECSKCKEFLDEDTTFCPKCGTKYIAPTDEGDIVKGVLTTDKEITALNKALSSDSCPSYEEYKIIARNKKTGKELDLATVPGVLEEEAGYNG